MSRYDENQLKTMLEGATPLQPLAGTAGVMASNMAALGVRDSGPSAPAQTAETFLKPAAPGAPGGMS